MNTARLRNISMLALLAFAAACTRSASTPPPGEGEGEEPADSQQATMEAVRSALLTQTAEAGGGEEVPTAPPPEATEEPEEETSGGGIVYVEYTVQEGDSITSIAEAFGVDPQAIVDLNGLGSPSEVTVGILIKIPPSTGATATPAPTTTGGGGGTVHVVQPGEWIWQIARNYGVDPNAIIEANDLANPSLVYPGQELIIP
jgi:LysM repeat protein